MTRDGRAVRRNAGYGDETGSTGQAVSTDFPVEAVQGTVAGVPPADAAIAERLRAQSPVANAQRLRRPVLLLAGGDDERVPIRSVLHYAATLRALDKDVSLFVDAEGGHQLVDPRTREAYFYLLEHVLHRRLGGAAPRAPDAELRAHLRKNLRLAGRDLAELRAPSTASTAAARAR